MHKLDSEHSLVKAMQTALKNDGALSRGRAFGQAQTLHSEKDCTMQGWHADYDPKKVAGVPKKPQSAVLALEPNTFFWVAGRDGMAIKIVMRPGDILVFDGDLVHAGAQYSKPNTRIHAYLTVDGLVAENSTWLVPFSSVCELEYPWIVQ